MEFANETTSVVIRSCKCGEARFESLPDIFQGQCDHEVPSSVEFMIGPECAVIAVRAN
jgi:hypothetical protein